MIYRIIIKQNLYYDSVSLMNISQKLKKLDGIEKAVVSLGTETNKRLLEEINFPLNEFESAGVNDLIIAISSTNEKNLDKALEKFEELLNKGESTGESKRILPKTLTEAIRMQSDTNLVQISLAGEFAYREAKKALELNRNVMLFSDNISLEEENKLKTLALEKGLLMMGPDCGTAIINQIPLAFANIIPKGSIGIIAASGTGAQEVSTLIAKGNGGISQLIGTGGRDLSITIGGKMMLLGLEALAEDDTTKVIVLISKPPAQEVAKKVLERASKINKKVIVHFIGGDREEIEKYNLLYSSNLEETSILALKEAYNYEFELALSEMELNALAEKEIAKMGKEQKYIRALYTGGTLADETMLYWQSKFGKVYSNTPLDEKYRLKDNMISQEDTILDLGDDEFTQGRAHPMIDPSYRALRLEQEAMNKNISVILLDFVLGYGAHNDPAGAMLPSIIEAKKKFNERGEYLSILASVCGTENDPQKLSEQENKLASNGIICLPSNWQMVKLAGIIRENIDG